MFELKALDALVTFIGFKFSLLTDVILFLYCVPVESIKGKRKKNREDYIDKYIVQSMVTN